MSKEAQGHSSLVVTDAQGKSQNLLRCSWYGLILGVFGFSCYENKLGLSGAYVKSAKSGIWHCGHNLIPVNIPNSVFVADVVT